MPLSLLGTFGGMYLFGYSLDNLSLMALTLCVGFVVDDAIVMLENITRHIEAGDPPFQAALKGSREIGFTIISMTLSLAAVFIPVLFMGAMVGRLLHEFAVTIAVAVLVSGFVSLTLTPMLCSRFVRGSHGRTRRNRLYALSEQAFQATYGAYDSTLKFVLRHRRTTLAGSALLLAATVVLFVRIPKGFFPSEDTGQIFAITEGAQGISFNSMYEHQAAVNRVISADTNVLNFTSSIGAGGSTVAANGGRVFIRLKPRSQRRLHVDQIIQKLRAKLAALPGIKVYLQNPPAIRIGGMLTRSLYQYTLQSTDTKELYHWASIIEAKMAQLSGFQDVSSDLLIRTPQVNVEIDRDKAPALGVSAEQIESALYDAYGSRQISTIYTPANEYWVVMELEPKFQQDVAALSQLYVRSASGRLVQLSAVAKITRSVGPMTVSHLGQLPAVTISFNLAPGVALGTAVEQVQKMMTEAQAPATLHSSFQGSAQVFQASLKGLGVLLVMSILVIYIILGILYESFIHPLTILSGLPSAGFGALLTLMLFGIDLNLYAFVGLIMLVGIVKKNAIMMIDFALDAQKQGRVPFDAIYEGCLLRFRPIMMTTMAALMSALPIAFGYAVIASPCARPFPCLASTAAVVGSPTSQRSCNPRTSVTNSSIWWGFDRNSRAPSSFTIWESAWKTDEDSTTTGNELNSGRVRSQSNTSKPFTFGIFKSNSSSRGNGYRSRSLNGGVPFKYSIVTSPSGTSIIWCGRPAVRKAHRAKYTSSRSSSASNTQCLVVIKAHYRSICVNHPAWIRAAVFQSTEFASLAALTLPSAVWPFFSKGSGCFVQ